MTKTDIVILATQKAAQYKLDHALVCAVIEQESNFDTLAVRLEQGFYQHYVKPLNLPTLESILRSASYGLMQIMGEVAREYGFAGTFDELCEPDTGLEYGCKHLARKLAIAEGNVSKALELWNGGGNPSYASEVLARVGTYTAPTT